MKTLKMFIAISLIFLFTSCSLFQPSASSMTTIEAVNSVIKTLPKEYHYLLAVDGDGIDVLRAKLVEALKELSRIEAKVDNAKSTGKDIIRRLEKL